MSRVLRLGRRGLTLRWSLLLWVARQLVSRGKALYGHLTPSERSELRRLVVKSKGRRGNLTAEEQKHLRGLVVRAGKQRESSI